MSFSSACFTCSPYNTYNINTAAFPLATLSLSGDHVILQHCEGYYKPCVWVQVVCIRDLLGCLVFAISVKQFTGVHAAELLDQQ